MFLCEYAQHCAQCEESTPHSQRLVALPTIVVVACFLAAACCLVAAWSVLEGPAGWVLGALLLFAGLFVLLRDREKCWAVACERCCGKQLLAIRRTKPRLDGNTEINIT